MINFDEFFDGESLKQEDLVVWMNLGMHHLPHTGDCEYLPSYLVESNILGSQKPHVHLPKVKEDVLIELTRSVPNTVFTTAHSSMQ